MKHYSHIILTLAICAFIWPLQSCANGATKSEVVTSENSDSSEYSDYSDLSDSSKKPGYRIFIEGLLQDASKKKADTCFPLFFAREFLDVPYVAHTLEVNDQEDLVINVRELDCTTLVENVVALTLCAYQKQFSFAAYQNNLRNMGLTASHLRTWLKDRDTKKRTGKKDNK